MSKIINLFAGPGAGKSTLAAGLFYTLKTLNFNCELAAEYAKDLAWEERLITRNNQIYVFGKQYHRIKRLVDKIDVIVTDSPLLLCLHYAGNRYPASFSQLVLDLHNQLNNINFFIRRTKPYQAVGRWQNAEAASNIDDDIYWILKNNNIKFTEISGDSAGLSDMIVVCKEELK